MLIFAKLKSIVYSAKQLIWIRICNGWTKKTFFENFSKSEFLTILSYIVKVNDLLLRNWFDNHAWFNGDYYFDFRAAWNYY